MAVNGTNSMTQLRSITCHMASHSVTFHPTQANTPRLNPSQTGWYSINRPLKDGGLCKPRPRVQRATVPRLLRDSPRPARLEPRPRDRQSSMLTTRLSRHPLMEEAETLHSLLLEVGCRCGCPQGSSGYTRPLRLFAITPSRRVFKQTGWMHLWTPNKQHQNTEGTAVQYDTMITF